MAEVSLEERMTAMVREHHEVVYRYAYRLTGSTFDAEDLTQQTFLLAQRNIDQLRDPSRGRSWLCTILRHCYLRQRRRKTPTAMGALEIDVNSIPETLPVRIDVDRERLQKALDDLPPEFKTPLLMFYFDDMSYREIAEELGAPIGTVMSRLSRAKAHLRNRLFEPETAMAGAATGRSSVAVS